MVDLTPFWSKERQETKAGTLTISSASLQKGAAGEPINFDPLVMADGIEPTDVSIFCSARQPIPCPTQSNRMRVGRLKLADLGPTGRYLSSHSSAPDLKRISAADAQIFR